MPFTRRVVEAFEWAFDLHRTQLRKGSQTPYFTHLLAVAAIVGEFGGDEDQLIAAFLHDAVEDQGGRRILSEIEKRFGATIAAYVSACTDAFEQPKPPWRARKEAFLESLRGAPEGAMLIVAADKLHNMRAVTHDLRRAGSGVWQRFTGGREGSLWYYREVIRALESVWQHAILEDLREALAGLEAADAAAQ